MRTFVIVLIILLFFTAAANAQITVMDSVTFQGNNENMIAGVQTVCIDGKQFVYAYGWAAHGTARGVGAGGGVSIVQVYEEIGGRTKPATCR